MPVDLHSSASIARLRAASQAAAQTLIHVGHRVAPGISTAQIDVWVREDTQRRGGTPSQLGYDGFPAAVCVSRNHVVCHGMPSAREMVTPSDILNIDVTTQLHGFHGDCSATFIMPGASAAARHVVAAARACRDAGIAVVREGARLGDIGAAVAETARAHRVCVVTDYGGHGIGRQMHLEPHVPHVGQRGKGLRLKAGMAFTIEPMVNLGAPAVHTLADGWTVVTSDGSLSAQFEHTVLVTRDGCEVLTLPEP